MQYPNKKIVFLGNMNNLPFGFAKNLKDRGYDVTLYIHVGANYTLDRPECLDNSITYPYPNWIKEMPASENLNIRKLVCLFFSNRKYLKLIDSADIVILNGDWISLGMYIRDERKKVVALFAGGDLDVKADYRNIYNSAYSIANRFKILFLVYPIILFITFFITFQQRRGIKRANKVNYFPTGIIPRADVILQKIMKGKNYERLELRGFSSANIILSPNKVKKQFLILNFTRFFFTDITSPDNKRNDIMIEGISKFIKKNKLEKDKVKIVFFKKGADLDAAIELIGKLGIAEFFEWHDPVSQSGLNQFIEDCDVAFDQLGNQWVGYGVVSMAFGKPLIANGRPEIFEKLTNETSPICQATNADDVAYHLNNLYRNPARKEEIGLKSRNYVLKHYNIDQTIDFIIN